MTVVSVFDGISATSSPEFVAASLARRPTSVGAVSPEMEMALRVHIPSGGVRAVSYGMSTLAGIRNTYLLRSSSSGTIDTTRSFSRG